MSAPDLTLVLVRLAIGCWLLWTVRTVTPPGRPVDLSDVSVVIPARNEASSLPVLLASLPSQADIVVVDDGSTDGTAEVAAAAGARVLRSASLPPGWTGKSWACWQGAAAVDGSTLVFVDADVRFAGGGLHAVVDDHAAAGGLLSVQPFHEPGGGAESLASIFNIVGYAGTDAASPLGRRRGARGAFGPVLATTRENYERVGGHEAVRDSVVDDVALATRYRAAGLPVTIRGGGQVVQMRMYPDGFGQMLAGFTKNVAAGAGAVRRGTAVLVVAWLSLLVQAAAAPGLALAAGEGLAGAGVLYSAVALQYWWMSRRLGRFGPVLALLFPVSVALFLVVFARSVWATATGSVSWRGRRVATGPASSRRRRTRG
ncbi:MAG: glycosyltransferase [Acidimicrobiales bacterium]